jgi:hypothetical protein
MFLVVYYTALNDRIIERYIEKNLEGSGGCLEGLTRLNRASSGRIAERYRHAMHTSQRSLSHSSTKILSHFASTLDRVTI